MKRRGSYFKLGLFVLVAVGLGLAALVVLGVGVFFRQPVYMETYLDESVQGLDVGSPVKHRGVQIGVVQQLVENGRSQVQIQAFNHQGQWQQSWDLGEDGWETAVHQFANSFAPLPQPLLASDRLHSHHAGWLIQEPQALNFIPKPG